MDQGQRLLRNKRKCSVHLLNVWSCVLEVHMCVRACAGPRLASQSSSTYTLLPGGVWNSFIFDAVIKYLKKITKLHNHRQKDVIQTHTGTFQS